MNDVQLKKWLWGVLALILFLFFLFWGISKIKKHKVEKQQAHTETKDSSKKETKKSEEVHYKVDYIVDKTILVNLTSEYGEIHTLDGGYAGFDFFEANVPYCVVNGYGADACGGKGENISSKLPKDSPGNCSLRFRYDIKNGNDIIGLVPTVKLVIYKRILIRE